MPTDFTVIDSSGEQADYRLDADEPVSRSLLTRLFADIGVEPPPGERCPHTGEVLDRCPAEVATPSTGAQLSVICGPDAGRTIPLINGVTTVGRDEQCTLVLTDPSVSRHHLEIEVSPRRTTVHQLAVTHHARLDGKRLVGPTTVQPGGLIRIANTVLRVADAARQDAPDSPAVAVAIEFPTAPTRRHHPIGLAAALVSGLAGLVAAAVTRSVELLVMAGLPALGLAAVSLSARSSHRRAGRRDEREYQAAQAQSGLALAQACTTEATQRHRDFPDPGALGANDIAPDATLRVRLGLGRQPALVEIRRATEPPTHPLLRDVPVTADLADGTLALCGPLPLARAQARWVLCQLAGRRGIRVTLWLSRDSESEWTWARWLPQLDGVHIGDSPPPAATKSGVHVTVIDHPLAEIRDLGLPSLVVTGNPRVPVVAAQATVPVDDTGLSQVLARVAHTAEVLEPTPFTADLVDLAFAERWARRLAGSWQAEADAAVPTEAALLDLLDLGPNPEAASIASEWESDPSSVRTPIGVRAPGLGGGTILEIDLDHDGPHALIAGTTGSGKSELLQTIVLGLAARYRPEAVQFLLIDYKGGAAFGRCAELPHTAGVVTDLDAQLTTRALRSLRAELRRRELLLASLAVPDFATLQRRDVDTPPPRLVVMVDEFATLAAELPEFVAGLVGIAQRGRSLGMHLVLATQRPAGAVSPEIRANTNLRIALRTISPAESIDVIESPDAADLDPACPGRAIRGGPNRAEFQVARIDGASARSPSDSATLTRLGPWRRPPVETDPHEGEPMAYGHLLVAQITAAAELAGVKTPEPPWLPPLPSSIRAVELSAADRSVIAVGMLDLPDEQRQDVITLDLTAGGSVAIAGGPRSGRSTALRAVATIAAARHGVNDLHLHLLDFGGGALHPLTALPHRGTVIDARDPSGIVSTFIAHLDAELGQRRSTGVATPAIVVLIDDWPSLTAAIDAHDLGATSERLRQLLPRCHGTGVTVLLTGDRSVLHPRLSSVLDERFALAFSDPNEYSMVGIAPSAVPDLMPPGRGMRLRDAVEVQFALPLAIDDIPVGACSQPITTHRIEVHALPTVTPIDLPRRDSHVCLGLGGDTAEPVWLSLASPPSLLVAGPHRSGRTTLLCSMLEQAVDNGYAVAALASQRSMLRVCAEQRRQTIVEHPADLREHDLVLVDDAEQWEGTTLADALEERLRTAPSGLVITTRSDAALTAFHGVVAELRRLGHGIVLQPQALDAELVGVRLGRHDLGGPPGRGIAVGDPAWGWPQPVEHPQWLGIQISAAPSRG